MITSEKADKFRVQSFRVLIALVLVTRDDLGPPGRVGTETYQQKITKGKFIQQQLTGKVQTGFGAK